MALPARISVKLSSEDAGAISISRVVRQDMAMTELFDRIVGAVGKDERHVQRVLRGGTLLDGGTRFRWEPVQAGPEEIGAGLSRFPDPDPERPFQAALCASVILLDVTGRSMTISKSAGAKRRFLRRRSFWDQLMRLAEAGGARYVNYSYRDRADCYRMEVKAGAGASLREAAGLLASSVQARQVRGAEIGAVEFLLPR